MVYRCGKSTLACWMMDTFKTNVFKISHSTIHALSDQVDEMRGIILDGHLHDEHLKHAKIRIIDTPGFGESAKNKNGEVLKDHHILAMIKVSYYESFMKLSSLNSCLKLLLYQRITSKSTAKTASAHSLWSCMKAGWMRGQ